MLTAVEVELKLKASCSQELATGPYPEPDESTRPPIRVL
jgi:hypothetical protein